MIENLVIGSGPTGVSAAYALRKLKQEITLIDGASELEPSKKLDVNRLKAKEFLHWDSSDFARYSELKNVDKRFKSHIGSKLKFGSFFPYAPADEFSDDQFNVVNKVNVNASLTRGGLSHVWGSIAFPYSLGDSLRLKSRIEDEIYQELESILTISGQLDDLSRIYGIPTKLDSGVKLSNMAESLDLVKNRKPKLEKLGFTSGFPRLAVSTSGRNACQSCGLCATGCIWDSIWDSSQALARLTRFNGINVITGVVTLISKESNGYRIVLANGKVLLAKRIFIACGAISSTLLLMKSNMISQRAYLADTQLSILPGIALHKKQTTRNFVLSQYILHKSAPDGSTDLFIQITGYNEDLVRRIQSAMPASRWIPTKLLDFAFKYLAVAMVFQKSETSGRLRIQRNNNEILVEKDEKEFLSVLLRSDYKAIKKGLQKLRIFPIKVLSQIVGVGESYHLGQLQCDAGERLLGADGEVPGYQNVYVVDSASLELIPPGPVTYPSMANAIRIVRTVTKT